MASSPSSVSPYWFPVAFLVFLGMWLFVGALLSFIAGWTALARDFGAKGPRPPGQRLQRQVVRMGWVGENGVTTLIPTAAGLYLYSHPLFRFRRPPLLVPWNAIRYTGPAGHLWWRSASLDLGGVTRIAVKLRGYAVLEPFLAQPERTTSDPRTLRRTMPT